MIEFFHEINIEETMNPKDEFRLNGEVILDKAIFLDLEHYIFKKPICIGIFGAAHIKGNKLIVEQYFLENSKDSEVLTKAAHKRLLELHELGYRYLVTFAGKNDTMVLNYMFNKYGIEKNLRELFTHIDIQREFEKNLGLE